MKIRTSLLFFLCALALALPAAASMGAVVGNVEKIDRHTVRVEIVNSSNKEITGYVVGVTQTRPDGHVSYSEHAEDFGPMLSQEHKDLLPGATHVFVSSLVDPQAAVSAKVLAILYGDHSAEAESEDALQRVVTVRKGIAAALKLSAQTYRDAASDPSAAAPHAKAAATLSQTLADQTVRESEDLDRSYLKQAVDDLNSAPRRAADWGVSVREYLKTRAAELDKQAALFSDYAQIRRGQ